MSDYISRQAAIETLNKLAMDNFTLADAFAYYLGALHDVAYSIKQLPSADVVEVVRCKNCKHNPKDAWFGCPMSHMTETQKPDTAWCWKGERKDGNV